MRYFKGIRASTGYLCNAMIWYVAMSIEPYVIYLLVK